MSEPTNTNNKKTGPVPHTPCARTGKMVKRLVAGGAPYREIAEYLDMNLNTLRAHYKKELDVGLRWREATGVRPIDEIDGERVEELALTGMHTAAVARFLGVDRGVIETTYRKYFDRGHETFCNVIRTAQMDKIDDPRMSIHLGKVYLGQNEKRVVKSTSTKKIEVVFNDMPDKKQLPDLTDVIDGEVVSERIETVGNMLDDE